MSADPAAEFAAICQLLSAVPRGRGTARTATALPPLNLFPSSRLFTFSAIKGVVRSVQKTTSEFFVIGP